MREDTRKKRKQNKRKTVKLSKKDKQKIVHRLLPTSQKKIESEYLQLKGMSCKKAKKASSRTTLGNNIVNAFTMIERLHTKGHQGISFYDFWENRDKYKEKGYVKNMLEFYKKRKIDEIRKYKYIYNLYFSSIAIFRPIMAMELYCRVNAKRVLDFTMGWGGRLVGACALSLECYYGIDLNKHLKKPYQDMVQTLESLPDHKTDIQLFFQDALKVDYSKLDYDTVFTSPPYYNLEMYRHQKHKHPNDWNETFYKPLFERTYKHLKKGGHYCLNIPENIYEDVCVQLFGKCEKKILLKKGERNLNGNYKEFIYIWIRES